MNKHLIWVIGLIIISSIICGTLIYVNKNSWTLRFEMDDNTKDAIESINYSEILGDKICYSENCYWDIEENLISGCSMSKVDCDEFEHKFGLKEDAFVNNGEKKK